MTAAKLGTKRKEKFISPKKLCNVFIDLTWGNTVIELILSGSIWMPMAERLHTQGILASYTPNNTYRIVVASYIFVSIVEHVGAHAHVATKMFYES